MYKCPKCNEVLDQLYKDCKCGYQVNKIDGIYHFSFDPSINLDSDNKYIGYDSIGKDFEPSSIFYNHDRYGVYDASGQELINVFGKDITILDLGAGLGTASIPLAKTGATVIACDISSNMLKVMVDRANNKYPNLIPVKMNAYNLHLADNSIDVVVENAMIHLVSNPDKVIKEIYRVLKPGGALVRYNTYGVKINDQYQEVNDYCNKVLNDISDFYYRTLSNLGFKTEELFQDHKDILLEYFYQYDIVKSDYQEEFTEKMKFRLHRLSTKAHSDLINIPNDIHNKVWDLTNQYAKEKYGPDYLNIPNYSKYGASIIIYKSKK